MAAEEIRADGKITKQKLINFLQDRNIKGWKKTMTRNELINIVVGAAVARPRSAKKPVTIEAVQKILRIVKSSAARAEIMAALRAREFTNDMLVAALLENRGVKGPSKSKKDDIIRYLLGDEIPARSAGRAASTQDIQKLKRYAVDLLAAANRGNFRAQLEGLTLKDIRVIGAEIRRIQKEKKQPVFSFSHGDKKPTKKEEYIEALIQLRPRQPRSKSGLRSPKVVSPIVGAMLAAAMTEAQKKINKREIAASCARSGSMPPSPSLRRSVTSSPRASPELRVGSLPTKTGDKLSVAAGSAAGSPAAPSRRSFDRSGLASLFA